MIRGKVLQILSDEEVVLSVGMQHGVKEGMIFIIYSNGHRIIDPHTTENLGPLETVKGKVMVTTLQPRFSRATTQVVFGSVPEAAEDFYKNTMAHRKMTRPQRAKLIINGQDAKPLNENLTVRVGDLVRAMETENKNGTTPNGG